MIRSFLRGTIHFAKSRSVILTICVAAAATSMPAAGPNTIVKAVGFRLQLNGQLFAIKGMNYSPVPKE